MKSRLLSTIALTSLCWVGNVLAQDQINLSGTWNNDPKRSESLAQARDASARSPVRLVIKQSSNDVRIDRYRANGERDSVTYVFDRAGIPRGVPRAPATRNSGAAADVGNAAITADSDAATGTVVNDARAEWNNGHLVLQTVLTINGRTVTTSETLSLAPSGELTVETLVGVQHGYESSGSGSKASSDAKDVYVRAKD